MRNTYITTTESNDIDMFVASNEPLSEEQYRQGFRRLNHSDSPMFPTDTDRAEYRTYVCKYFLNTATDEYDERYVTILDTTRIIEEIRRLKAELASTDYIVTKVSEYRLLESPTPEQTAEAAKYDLDTITAQREAHRQKIRELRELLNQTQTRVS